MKKIFAIACLISCFFTPSLFAAVSANKIVDRADEYRGLKTESYTINVTTVRIRPKKKVKKGTVEVLLRSKKNSEKAIVKFMAPAKDKGKAILTIDRDTWFHIPKTKKLIRITPSQKVLGEASAGDIAATRYAEDYDAKILGEETVGKVLSFHLDLKANNRQATYHRIEYWVDKKTYRPVKAKYYSLSGKLMKVAFWKKFKKYRGREMVEKLLIADPLIKGKYTLLINNDYRKDHHPENLFRKENLNRL